MTVNRLGGQPPDLNQVNKRFNTDTLNGEQKTFLDQFMTDVFKDHDGKNPIANSLKIATANNNTQIKFKHFDKKEQHGVTQLKLNDGEQIADKAQIELSIDNNFKTVNKNGLAAVNGDKALKAKAYGELADTLGNELASALSPQQINSKEHEAVTFKFGHWFSLLAKRMANGSDKDKPVTVKDMEKETKTMLPDGVKKAVNTYDAYKNKTNNAADNTALRLEKLGLFKGAGPDTQPLIDHIQQASDITNPDKPDGKLAKWVPDNKSGWDG